MNVANQATNKALALLALDTLFNRKDYRVAEQFWAPRLIMHCAHIAPGRDGLFEFVKSAPRALKYEPGIIVASDDYVIIHGRISGNSRPCNLITATILRIEGGLVVEQWEVVQDEASQEESKSGYPMFGDRFSI
jgi:predicted SnoaL-like aldol condensation-catalyzing enzyme